MTDTPIVQGNILLGDTPIEVGSPEWFAWLDDPATKSFSYEKDSFTRFLARKRETKSGSGTWSAHKKVKGEVRVLGLGSTSDLTKEALESIVEEISTYDVDRWEKFKAARAKSSPGQGLYKPAKQKIGITLVQDSDRTAELEKLRAELKSKDEAIAQLQSQLKAVKAERDKLSQEATELFKTNQELGKDARESKALVDAYREQWQAEVNKLVEKLEAKDKVITSLQSEKTQLQAQLAEYRTEVSTPKQQWQRVGTITLTQKEMAERLGKATTTLWRNHPRFPEYSQGKDPEGKAWQWDESAKAYYEVIQNGV